MTFNNDMRQLVLSHPAINNDFLTRFSRAQISDAEFLDFAEEFFHFSRTFPAILANLLVNIADENEAFELTKVLTSELGDGDPTLRHELLFRRFLRSVGIAPEKVVNASMKPTTKRFIDGLRELYGGRNHARALGASFGLENMAIPMWDQLIPGLERIKQTKKAEMNIEYFTFHRELESQREDAMEEVSKGLEDHVATRKSFKTGTNEALNLLHRFWPGLERN